MVVGAGIAGLTAAVALARQGRAVRVFERRQDLGEAGAGITLWPNALAALDVIGLGDAVRRAGCAVTSGGLRRPDGSWRQRSLDADRVRRALGEPLVVVRRGDLLDVLASELDSAQISFGVQIDSYRVAPGEPGLSLCARDGQQIEAAGVICADGIGSTLARQLQPRLQLRYAGYTAWRGVAHLDVSGLEPGETWGPTGEFGFLPMAAGRAYWFATENTAQGGTGPAGERRYLLERFATWHEPIRALITATDDSDLLRHDIYDRDRTADLSDGPVVLVGDAAHPMRPHLGQGGCQAIEDGVILAEAVRTHKDLPGAFATFARIRRRRVTPIVAASARIGRIIHGEGLMASAGRTSVSILPTALTLRYLAGTGSARAFHARGR